MTIVIDTRRDSIGIVLTRVPLDGTRYFHAAYHLLKPKGCRTRRGGHLISMSEDAGLCKLV